MSALLAALLVGCAPRGAPSLLVLDRGAGELLVLDGALLVQSRLAVGRAERLVIDGQGAAWLAGPTPRGRARLARLPPGGGLHPVGGAFEGLLDLAPASRGVYVLEGNLAVPRIWRVEDGRMLLGVCPQARCLAASGGSLLVGTVDGALLRLGPGGAVQATSTGIGAVRALAPGPGAQRWWVLRGPVGGAASVECVGADLVPLWSVVLDPAASSLASEGSGGGVWVAGGERVGRYAPGGRLAFERELGGGPWFLGPADAHGAFLASAGALVRLGTEGTVRASQGGFRALAGVGLRGPSAPGGGARPPPASSRPGSSPARAREAGAGPRGPRRDRARPPPD